MIFKSIKKRRKYLGVIFVVLVVFGITYPVLAQNRFQYNLMVPLPQPGPGGNVATTVTGIADYIRTLYLFALLLGGILAFGALVFAGFLWLTSGAVGQISRAKSMITNALLGLALLATSYIILNTINPELVRFEQKVAQPVNIAPAVDRFPDVSEKCDQIKAKGYCRAYYEAMGWWHSPSEVEKWNKACNKDACDVDNDGTKDSASDSPCQWTESVPLWLYFTLDVVQEWSKNYDCVEKPGAGGPGPSGCTIKGVKITSCGDYDRDGVIGWDNEKYCNNDPCNVGPCFYFEDKFGFDYCSG